MPNPTDTASPENTGPAALPPAAAAQPPHAGHRHGSAALYSLAALSGLLLTGAFAPLASWAVAWVALVPLFSAVLKSRGPRQAARLGAGAGLVFYTISLRWMPNAVYGVALIFWCIFSLWLAMHAALMRGLWTRLEKKGAAGALAWTAAAAVSWAGIEYFRSEVWLLPCPWLGLGYSQAGNPPLLQTLSVWGVYGLSAFIAAFSAALALLGRKIRVPAAVLVCALLAAALWGRHRLAVFSPEAGTPLKVALVQAESVPVSTLIRYSLAPEALDAGLLLWPENSVMLPGSKTAAYLRLLEKELKPSRAVVAIGVGINVTENGRLRRENFMLFLNSAKKPVGRYDKMHPVPQIEAGLPASRRAAAVNTELGKLGPQICYDLAFEDGTRKVTAQGARLLVSPTLDPREWGELQHTQHSDMSGARAVEAGLWLVRAASSGRSQIIDPLGAQRAALEKGEGVLTGTAYLMDGGTFYTRLGWLFAPAALVFTILAAAWLLAGSYPRRRGG